MSHTYRGADKTRSNTTSHMTHALSISTQERNYQDKSCGRKCTSACCHPTKSHLAASGGEAAHLAMLHGGLADPVDARIATNSLVGRIHQDDLRGKNVLDACKNMLSVSFLARRLHSPFFDSVDLSQASVNLASILPRNTCTCRPGKPNMS